MKVFKWNVGAKGLIIGSLGLIAATLLGKVSTDEIEGSVTKLPPQPKEENNEKAQENSEEKEPEGEALKPDEIIDKK